MYIIIFRRKYGNNKFNSKKDKKANLISYSFSINNEHFVAHYIYGKKPKFELFHNDSLIKSSDQINNKLEISVNTESEILNILVWMEYSIYSIYIGKINGIGISVNGNPVENTLTDTEVYIKNGRSGFYVLMFFLGLKIALTYYQLFKEYTSHFVAIISCLIYFIPLIIIALFTIIYKKLTKISLIIGMVFSILEFLDYAVALPSNIISGSNGAMLLFWIAIRISVFCIFFNTFKKTLKQNNLQKIQNS